MVSTHELQRNKVKGAHYFSSHIHHSDYCTLKIGRPGQTTKLLFFLATLYITCDFIPSQNRTKQNQNKYEDYDIKFTAKSVIIFLL